MTFADLDRCEESVFNWGYRNKIVNYGGDLLEVNFTMSPVFWSMPTEMQYFMNYWFEKTLEKIQIRLSDGNSFNPMIMMSRVVAGTEFYIDLYMTSISGTHGLCDLMGIQAKYYEALKLEAGDV